MVCAIRSGEGGVGMLGHVTAAQARTMGRRQHTHTDFYIGGRAVQAAAELVVLTLCRNQASQRQIVARFSAQSRMHSHLHTAEKACREQKHTKNLGHRERKVSDLLPNTTHSQGNRAAGRGREGSEGRILPAEGIQYQ